MTILSQFNFPSPASTDTLKKVSVVPKEGHFAAEHENHFQIGFWLSKEIKFNDKMCYRHSRARNKKNKKQDPLIIIPGKPRPDLVWNLWPRSFENTNGFGTKNG